MKYLSLLAVCVICIFTSCTLTNNKKKSTYNPSLPYRPVNISDNTERRGYGVYMKTCYQCHDQTDPSTLSTKKWTMTVPAMAEHAGITEEEGKQVLEYILYVKSQELR